MSEPAYFAHACGRPSTWEMSAIRSLGPRIKWSAINTSEHQYNQTLFAEVADPSHYTDYPSDRKVGTVIYYPHAIVN